MRGGRGSRLFLLILLIPLFPIDQFERHHLRSISLPKPQRGHPRESRGSLTVALFKEFHDLLAGILMRHELVDRANCVARVFRLRRRDDLLHDRPHHLGALLRRPDGLVEDHGRHKVALHRPAVRGFVTEPETGDAVSHG